MDRKENISSNGWMQFVGRYSQYVFVLVIFSMTILYHYFIIPPETVKNNTVSKDKVQAEQPDLDIKHQEKIYPQIFQSQVGDVFRVGALVRVKSAENVEIFVQSRLNEVLKIGDWHLEPSENGEYKELVFSTSGYYENIIIRLKENAEINTTKENTFGDTRAVFIRSFFVSRVEAKNALEIKNLTPTVFGISSTKRDVLFQDGQGSPVKWVFQSNGDFLQALEFSGKIVGRGRQEYVFNLIHYFPDKKEDGELVHTSSFVLDALSGMSVPTGNYQVSFPSTLVSGEWYKVTLTRTPSKDQSNFFTVGPLEVDTVTDINAPVGDLALLVGEHLRTKNNAIFPDGAKLEDMGKNLSYSFSLQGTALDFANIYDASSGISYDVGKRLVTGNQKNREYFTYKFDTVYPFDRFVLDAIGEGNDTKVKLEYSFDNVFWREIPFSQATNDSQKFLLALDGNNKSQVVYVRVSYAGVEKKSGFFALRTLNIDASISK